MSETGPEASEVRQGSIEVVVSQIEGVDMVAVAELAREGACEHIVTEANHPKLREQAEAVGRDGAAESFSWQADLRDPVLGAHHAIPGARRCVVQPIQLVAARVKRVPERDQRSRVSCQVLACYGEDLEQHKSGDNHFGHTDHFGSNTLMWSESS